MKIGKHNIEPALVLAPMAGVSDLPFRILCRRSGAGLAVSEMVASNSLLYGSAKTLRRMDSSGEPGPVSVQIVGHDPAMLAAAARYNADHGADIVDINMGCPARKICNVQAGSALLRDETRVAAILRAVVAAVDVPVTLKIRTGWDRAHRNAVQIARIAEAEGIAALTIHGRTRACGFGGQAEYDTIADVVAQVAIPVIANGDITDPQKARAVLAHTGAAGVMIGRAAMGRPWLFRQVAAALAGRSVAADPGWVERAGIVTEHLRALYAFYGEARGVRIARKHISWYLRGRPHAAAFRDRVNRFDTAAEQLHAVAAFMAGDLPALAA